MRYYSFLLEDTPPSSGSSTPSTPPAAPSSPPSNPPKPPSNTNPLKTGNKAVDAAREKSKQNFMKNAYNKEYNKNKAGVGGTVMAGLGGATLGLGTGLIHAAGSAIMHPIKTLTGKNNLLGKVGAHMGIGAAAAGAHHVITTNNKAKTNANAMSKAAGMDYDNRIMQKNQKLNAMKNPAIKPA